jgi:hypothetical protein
MITSKLVQLSPAYAVPVMERSCISARTASTCESSMPFA